MLKPQFFAPTHLLMDDMPYFITASIYLQRRLLAGEGLKWRLLGLIQETFEAKGWQLHHWVILDNHYHLLGMSREGADLATIMRQIHCKSALWIREATACDTPVWWNYWDYCPRDEDEYFVRLNYLLMNPIKHGYVDNLHDYPYSSFHQLFNEKGKAALTKQLHDYPKYRELKVDADDF